MAYLDEVASFVKVVESGSMNSAAKDLKVPRSTVSRHLTRLESRLGSRLLRRTTRTMALTEEGAAYYERVAPALRAIHSADREVHERGSSPQGTIRVSAPVDLGVFSFPAVIVRFLEKYPEVSLDLDLSNRFVDLVREGFDVALRAGSLTDSTLIAKKLGTSHFGIYASPRLLERLATPKKPEDLTQHPCVLMRSPSMSTIWKLENDRGERNDVTVTGRLSGSDFGFLMRATVEGAGFALLPDAVTHAEVVNGRLIRVLPRWAVRSEPLSFVMPPGRQTTPKVRAFQEFMAPELTTSCSAPKKKVKSRSPEK